MRGEAGGSTARHEKQKVNHHRILKTKNQDRKPNNLPSIRMFSSRRGMQEIENQIEKTARIIALKRRREEETR